MGEFELRMPRTRVGLGNFRLRLDPAIEADMQRLAGQARTADFRLRFLQPNWRHLRQSQLDQWLTRPPTAPRAPLVPRGAHDGEPRAAKVGHVMDAIWRIPSVRAAANNVLQQISHRFAHGWRNASGGERALVISSVAVIGGGALGMIASDPETRQVLELIKDTDIPVPGVNGLSFRLSPGSVGARFSTPRLYGVGVSGRGSVDTSTGRIQYRGMVTFDAMTFLR